MGDKKVDILAEYNERESQVVKWSAYSRNELSEEFRAEIEAELITKRALKGGTDEQKKRHDAEKAKLRRKIQALKAPKDPKLPTANDAKLIGSIPWKPPRESEKVNKFVTRWLPRPEDTEDQPYGKKPTKREIRLLREGLCPPPPPPEPPSTPPRRVSVLALRPQDMDKLKEKQALSAEIDRAFSGSKYA